MTDEKPFYSIVCDSCNTQTEYWSSKDIAESLAEESNWWLTPHGDYCPDCHTIDDQDNRSILCVQII